MKERTGTYFVATYIQEKSLGSDYFFHILALTLDIVNIAAVWSLKN